MSQPVGQMATQISRAKRGARIRSRRRERERANEDSNGKRRHIARALSLEPFRARRRLLQRAFRRSAGLLCEPEVASASVESAAKVALAAVSGECALLTTMNGLGAEWPLIRLALGGTLRAARGAGVAYSAPSCAGNGTQTNSARRRLFAFHS